MPHKVVLDDDVFEALQKEATPLVDDVNSVLRRKLGLGDAAAPVPRRPPRAKNALPDEEFEFPLLQALIELGGAGPTKLVIDKVGELLADRLSDADRAPLASSKEPRWRNRTQFARLRLVKTGDMTKDSPRGYWEITESGRSRAKSI
jgi:hypothetical protein